jgi:hypothetical protein
VTSTAAKPEVDAKLVQLAAELAEKKAIAAPLGEEVHRLTDLVGTAWRQVALQNGGATRDDLVRISEESGREAAIDRHNAELDACGRIAEQIRGIPAEGAAGIEAKVYALLWDVCAGIDLRAVSDPSISDIDADWDVLCVRNFIREMEQMAPRRAGT